MQIFRDYFMMTVDQRYESSIGPDGIITLNSAWIHSEAEERFYHKRIYGRVEACPMEFSDMTIDLIDPGFPTPKKYISGEYIDHKIALGYKDYTREGNYCCAGFDDYERISSADWAKNCDIRRFDRIYFDPKVTEPQNMLGKHNGGELYKIRVDEIICVVRHGQIIAQGEWLLVEPDMETWDEITMPSGIIRKPNPEARELRGIVRHFTGRNDIKVGDVVIHEMGANWSIEVEGKKYYALQNIDVVAKVEK